MGLRTVIGMTVIGMLAWFGAAPAGAVKPPPVVGTIQCATSSAAVAFSPGLQYKGQPGGPSRGRGPSSATWSAALHSCTDGSAGAAPGGLDHATFSAADRIAGSYCEGSAAMRFSAKITWFRADNSVAGVTNLKVATTLHSTGFYDPIVLEMTATAKPSSTVAPGETLSASLPSGPYWAYSANCGKVQLPGLTFADSSVTLT